MFSKAGKYDLHIPDHYNKSNYYTFSPTLLYGKNFMNINDELALLLEKHIELSVY